MKRTVTFFFSFLFINTCLSQPSNPPNHSFDRAYNLQKSKHQKKAAWILLGTGVTGIAVAASEVFKWDTQEMMIILSDGAILGSIPLFIAAGRNRRKALNISSKLELNNGNQLSTIYFKKRYMPAISLKLNL